MVKKLVDFTKIMSVFSLYFFIAAVLKETSFWSGYYASRSQLKADIRGNASLLSTCNILQTTGMISSKATTSLKTVVALTQHHDAITGTEKQHVVDDYNRRLKLAEDKCRNEIASATENNDKITIINPLPFDRSEMMNAEMVDIPGFGWVVTEKFESFKHEKNDIESDSANNFVLQNEEIGVTFSIDSFVTKVALTNKTTNSKFLTFEHTWKYFLADPGCDYPCIDSGNGTGLSQPSGAYVMRPLDNIDYSSENNGAIISSDGNSIDVNQDYINYSWRLNGDKVFLDYEIGELPIFSDNSTGREVFSRFEVIEISDKNLNNIKSIWSTDTNSIGRIERSRENTRPMDPIASRYFPMTSETLLDFAGDSFSVSSTRAAGVTSLESSQLDVMLHRRTLKDDWKGLNQPMDDKSSVSGSLQIGIEGSKNKNVVATKKLHNPVLVVDGELTIFENIKTGLSGLIEPFCENGSCSLFKKSRDASNFFENDSEDCFILSLEVDTYDENILFIQFEQKGNNQCVYKKFVETFEDTFQLLKDIKSVRQVNVGGTSYFCENDESCYLDGKVFDGKVHDRPTPHNIVTVKIEFYE